ncbi:hypothetical protein AAG906_009269 [Vitis piasezkii]
MDLLDPKTSKVFKVNGDRVKPFVEGINEGELRGIILEKSRGFSTWIRFGDSSLRCFLEGVEVCCREERLGKVAKEEEKKRSFVEVAKAKTGRIGDVAWLQLGDEALRRSRKSATKRIRHFKDKTFHLERKLEDSRKGLIVVDDDTSKFVQLHATLGVSGGADGAEVGVGNDGNGKGKGNEKRVVEVTSVSSYDGVRLKGKGSWPRVLWVESDKVRNNELLRAQDSCQRVVVKFGPVVHEVLRMDLSLGILGAGGLGDSSQSNFPTVSQEAILSVVLLAKERGKFRAYESLLEEASRYSHFETCSFLSLEGQGSSSSFVEGKKRWWLLTETLWRSRGHPIKVIKALIKDQNVDLVCLQETKMQEMSERIVRSLGVGRCLDWEAVNLRGASGGVLVFPVESTMRSRLTYSMRRFSKIIEDLELRDLPLQGGSFAWNGGLFSNSSRWGMSEKRPDAF